jgi:hypothetical protein
MTAIELIKELQKVPNDTLVLMTYNDVNKDILCVGIGDKKAIKKECVDMFGGRHPRKDHYIKSTDDSAVPCFIIMSV